MKTIVKVTVGAFLYFFLIMSIFLWFTFAAYSGEVFRSLQYGTLGGFYFAGLLTAYLLIGLILFKYRLCLYSNIGKELQNYKIKSILHEGVAGDTSRGGVKYGGLFLTDEAILFIPHRFAIRSQLIHLPLAEVKSAALASINLKKAFSGGVRSRLLVETKIGEKYEFIVWDLSSWITHIRERIAREPGWNEV